MTGKKLIKNILIEGADGASPEFVANVIRKVEFERRRSLPADPLVPPRFVRLFLYLSGGVVSAILVICAILTFGDERLLKRFTNAFFPDINYKSVLLYIGVFWIVLIANEFWRLKKR